MNEVTLTATTGRKLGSPDSRRMRAEGKIPAVVYGLGKEAVSLTVERADFRRAMTTEMGENALVKLDVDGDSDHVLVVEMQRHPVRREVLHIDFQRIDPEKPMVLTVPLVMVGDDKKVTSMGGVTELRLKQLKVTVRPDSIPTKIDVNVSGMEIGKVITVADLQLPSGVSTEVDPERPVVTAALTRAAIVAARQAQAGTGEAAKGKK